jgi:hypothetical protein
MRHLQPLLLAPYAATLQSQTISLSLFVVRRARLLAVSVDAGEFLFSKERICDGGSL